MNRVIITFLYFAMMMPLVMPFSTVDGRIQQRVEIYVEKHQKYCTRYRKDKVRPMLPIGITIQVNEEIARWGEKEVGYFLRGDRAGFLKGGAVQVEKTYSMKGLVEMIVYYEEDEAYKRKLLEEIEDIRFREGGETLVYREVYPQIEKFIGKIVKEMIVERKIRFIEKNLGDLLNKVSPEDYESSVEVLSRNFFQYLSKKVMEEANKMFPIREGDREEKRYEIKVLRQTLVYMRGVFLGYIQERLSVENKERENLNAEIVALFDAKIEKEEGKSEEMKMNWKKEEYTMKVAYDEKGEIRDKKLEKKREKIWEIYYEAGVLNGVEKHYRREKLILEVQWEKGKKVKQERFKDEYKNGLEEHFANDEGNKVSKQLLWNQGEKIWWKTYQGGKLIQERHFKDDEKNQMDRQIEWGDGKIRAISMSEYLDAFGEDGNRQLKRQEYKGFGVDSLRYQNIVGNILNQVFTYAKTFKSVWRLELQVGKPEEQILWNGSDDIEYLKDKIKKGESMSMTEKQLWQIGEMMVFNLLSKGEGRGILNTGDIAIGSKGDLMLMNLSFEEHNDEDKKNIEEDIKDFIFLYLEGSGKEKVLELISAEDQEWLNRIEMDNGGEAVDRYDVISEGMVKGIESIRGYKGGFQNLSDREVYYEEMEGLKEVFEVIKKIDIDEALKTKTLSRKWKDLTYIPKSALLEIGSEARTYIKEGRNDTGIHERNTKKILGYQEEVLRLLKETNEVLQIGVENDRDIKVQIAGKEEVINFGKEILKIEELYESRFRELKALAEQGEIRPEVKMNVDKEGEVDVRRLNNELRRKVRIGFFGVPLTLIHHGHILTVLEVMVKYKLDKLVWIVQGIDETVFDKTAYKMRYEMLKQTLEPFGSLFEVMYRSGTDRAETIYRFLERNKEVAIGVYSIKDDSQKNVKWSKKSRENRDRVDFKETEAVLGLQKGMSRDLLLDSASEIDINSMERWKRIKVVTVKNPKIGILMVRIRSALQRKEEEFVIGCKLLMNIPLEILKVIAERELYGMNEGMAKYLQERFYATELVKNIKESRDTVGKILIQTSFILNINFADNHLIKIVENKATPDQKTAVNFFKETQGIQEGYENTFNELIELGRQGEIRPDVKINVDRKGEVTEEDKKKHPNRALKVGFFGIAGNPVHQGHILTALKAIAEYKLDKVVWIVHGVASKIDDLIEYDTRYEMLKRALEPFGDLFEVTDISRDTPYSAETHVYRFLEMNEEVKIAAYYFGESDHTQNHGKEEIDLPDERQGWEEKHTTNKNGVEFKIKEAKENKKYKLVKDHNITFVFNKDPNIEKLSTRIRSALQRTEEIEIGAKLLDYVPLNILETISQQQLYGSGESNGMAEFVAKKLANLREVQSLFSSYDALDDMSDMSNMTFASNSTNLDLISDSLEVEKTVFYYPNNNVYAFGYYHEKYRTGNWIWKHPNGEIALEGSYDDGEPIGDWNYTSEDRNFKLRITYEETNKRKYEEIKEEKNKKTKYIVSPYKTRISKYTKIDSNGQHINSDLDPKYVELLLRDIMNIEYNNTPMEDKFMEFNKEFRDYNEGSKEETLRTAIRYITDQLKQEGFVVSQQGLDGEVVKLKGVKDADDEKIEIHLSSSGNVTLEHYTDTNKLNKTYKYIEGIDNLLILPQFMDSNIRRETTSLPEKSSELVKKSIVFDFLRQVLRSGEAPRSTYRVAVSDVPTEEIFELYTEIIDSGDMNTDSNYLLNLENEEFRYDYAIQLGEMLFFDMLLGNFKGALLGGNESGVQLDKYQTFNVTDATFSIVNVAGIFSKEEILADHIEVDQENNIDTLDQDQLLENIGNKINEMIDQFNQSKEVSFIQTLMTYRLNGIDEEIRKKLINKIAEGMMLGIQSIGVNHYKILFRQVEGLYTQEFNMFQAVFLKVKNIFDNKKIGKKTMKEVLAKKFGEKNYRNSVASRNLIQKGMLERIVLNKNKIDGEYIEYYFNDSKHREVSYKNGKKVGKEIFYDIDGNIIEERYYNKEGELHGFFQTWHILENGNRQLAEQMEYKKGKLDGKVLEFFSDGSIKLESYYKNGRLHGNCIEYEFNKDIKKGNVLPYFVKGNSTRKNVDKIKLMNLFFQDGEIWSGYLRKEIRDNVHEIFNYKEGVLHGEYIKMFDGTVTIEKGEYVKGQKTGKWYEIDLDTNEEQWTTFVQGKRSGLYRHTDDDYETKGEYFNDFEFGRWGKYKIDSKKSPILEKELFYSKGKRIDVEIDVHQKRIDIKYKGSSLEHQSMQEGRQVWGNDEIEMIFEITTTVETVTVINKHAGHLKTVYYLDADRNTVKTQYVEYYNNDKSTPITTHEVPIGGVISSGKFRIYFPDEMEAVNTTIDEDGEMDGYYEYNYLNGNRLTGHYIHGKKDSQWTMYYKKLNKHVSITYLEDEIQSWESRSTWKTLTTYPGKDKDGNSNTIFIENIMKHHSYVEIMVYLDRFRLINKLMLLKDKSINLVLGENVIVTSGEHKVSIAGGINDLKFWIVLQENLNLSNLKIDTIRFKDNADNFFGPFLDPSIINILHDILAFDGKFILPKVVMNDKDRVEAPEWYQNRFDFLVEKGSIIITTHSDGHKTYLCQGLKSPEEWITLQEKVPYVRFGQIVNIPIDDNKYDITVLWDELPPGVDPYIYRDEDGNQIFLQNHEHDIWRNLVYVISKGVKFRWNYESGEYVGKDGESYYLFKKEFLDPEAPIKNIINIKGKVDLVTFEDGKQFIRKKKTEEEAHNEKISFQRNPSTLLQEFFANQFMSWMLPDHHIPRAIYRNFNNRNEELYIEFIAHQHVKNKIEIPIAVQSISDQVLSSEQWIQFGKIFVLDHIFGNEDRLINFNADNLLIDKNKMLVPIDNNLSRDYFDIEYANQIFDVKKDWYKLADEELLNKLKTFIKEIVENFDKRQEKHKFISKILGSLYPSLQTFMALQNTISEEDIYQLILIGSLQAIVGITKNYSYNKVHKFRQHMDVYERQMRIHEDVNFIEKVFGMIQENFSQSFFKEHILYYPNNSVAIQGGFVKKNTPYGEWKWFYEDESLALEGAYNDKGEKERWWRYESEDGTESVSVEFKEDIIQSYQFDDDALQHKFTKDKQKDNEKILNLINKVLKDTDGTYKEGSKKYLAVALAHKIKKSGDEIARDLEKIKSSLGIQDIKVTMGGNKEKVRIWQEIEKIRRGYENTFKELIKLAEQGEIRPDVKINIDKKGEVTEEDKKKHPNRALKVGFFGVAENSVHEGHILTVLEVMAEYKLDKVVWIIHGDQTKSDDLIEYETRYEILKGALESFGDLFEVTDISRDTPYSAEMHVYRFLEMNEDIKIKAYYLVGSDHFNYKDKQGELDTVGKFHKFLKEGIDLSDEESKWKVSNATNSKSVEFRIVEREKTKLYQLVPEHSIALLFSGRDTQELNNGFKQLENEWEMMRLQVVYDKNSARIKEEGKSLEIYSMELSVGTSSTRIRRVLEKEGEEVAKYGSDSRTEGLSIEGIRKKVLKDLEKTQQILDIEALDNQIVDFNIDGKLHLMDIKQETKEIKKGYEDVLSELQKLIKKGDIRPNVKINIKKNNEVYLTVQSRPFKVGFFCVLGELIQHKDILMVLQAMVKYQLDKVVWMIPVVGKDDLVEYEIRYQTLKNVLKPFGDLFEITNIGEDTEYSAETNMYRFMEMNKRIEMEVYYLVDSEYFSYIDQNTNEIPIVEKFHEFMKEGISIPDLDMGTWQIENEKDKGGLDIKTKRASKIKKYKISKKHRITLVFYGEDDEVLMAGLRRLKQEGIGYSIIEGEKTLKIEKIQKSIGISSIDLKKLLEKDTIEILKQESKLLSYLTLEELKIIAKEELYASGNNNLANYLNLVLYDANIRRTIESKEKVLQGLEVTHKIWNTLDSKFKALYELAFSNLWILIQKGIIRPDMRINLDKKWEVDVQEVKDEIGSRAFKVGFLEVDDSPLHHGHILTALKAIAEYKLDKVVWVLGDIKAQDKLIEYETRYDMLKRALNPFGNLFEVTKINQNTEYSTEMNMYRFLEINEGIKMDIYYLIGYETVYYQDKNNQIDTIKKLHKFLREGADISEKKGVHKMKNYKIWNKHSITLVCNFEYWDQNKIIAELKQLKDEDNMNQLKITYDQHYVMIDDGEQKLKIFRMEPTVKISSTQIRTELGKIELPLDEGVLLSIPLEVLIIIIEKELYKSSSYVAGIIREKLYQEQILKVSKSKEDVLKSLDATQTILNITNTDLIDINVDIGGKTEKINIMQEVLTMKKVYDETFDKILEFVKTGTIRPDVKLKMNKVDVKKINHKIGSRALKIGFFGVVGNPVDNVDILTALEAIATYQLDKVVWILHGVNEKNIDDIIDYKTRYKMLKKALKQYGDLFDVTDISEDTEYSTEMHLYRFMKMNEGIDMDVYYLVGSEYFKYVDKGNNLGIVGEFHGFFKRGIEIPEELQEWTYSYKQMTTGRDVKVKTANKTKQYQIKTNHSITLLFYGSETLKKERGFEELEDDNKMQSLGVVYHRDKQVIEEGKQSLKIVYMEIKIDRSSMRVRQVLSQDLKKPVKQRGKLLSYVPYEVLKTIAVRGFDGSNQKMLEYLQKIFSYSKLSSNDLDQLLYKGVKQTFKIRDNEGNTVLGIYDVDGKSMYESTIDQDKKRIGVKVYGIPLEKRQDHSEKWFYHDHLQVTIVPLFKTNGVLDKTEISIEIINGAIMVLTLDQNDHMKNMISYHSNTQIALIGDYHEAQMHGMWSFYHSNGQIRGLGSYERGERRGEWKFFTYKKQLLAHGVYDQNGRFHGNWFVSPYFANYKEGKLQFQSPETSVNIDLLLLDITSMQTTYYREEGEVYKVQGVIPEEDPQKQTIMNPVIDKYEKVNISANHRLRKIFDKNLTRLERYSTGTIKEAITYQDGIRKIEKFDTQGRKISEAFYNGTNPVQTHTSWYENEDVDASNIISLKIKYYKDGSQSWEEFFRDGQIRERYALNKYNRYNGRYIKYGMHLLMEDRETHEARKKRKGKKPGERYKIEDSTYQNGKMLHGEKIQKINIENSIETTKSVYKNGELDMHIVKVEMLFRTGKVQTQQKISRYKNGKKHGKYQKTEKERVKINNAYYVCIKNTIGEYTHGFLGGIYKATSAYLLEESTVSVDRSLTSSIEGRYRLGKSIGLWRNFDDSKLISEIIYDENKSKIFYAEFDHKGNRIKVKINEIKLRQNKFIDGFQEWESDDKTKKVLIIQIDNGWECISITDDREKTCIVLYIDENGQLFMESYYDDKLKTERMTFLKKIAEEDEKFVIIYKQGKLFSFAVYDELDVKRNKYSRKQVFSIVKDRVYGEKEKFEIMKNFRFINDVNDWDNLAGILRKAVDYYWKDYLNTRTLLQFSYKALEGEPSLSFLDTPSLSLDRRVVIVEESSFKLPLEDIKTLENQGWHENKDVILEARQVEIRREKVEETIIVRRKNGEEEEKLVYQVDAKKDLKVEVEGTSLIGDQYKEEFKDLVEAIKGKRINPSIDVRVEVKTGDRKEAFGGTELKKVGVIEIEEYLDHSILISILKKMDQEELDKVIFIVGSQDFNSYKKRGKILKEALEPFGELFEVMGIEEEEKWGEKRGIEWLKGMNKNIDIKEYLIKGDGVVKLEDNGWWKETFDWNDAGITIEEEGRNEEERYKVLKDSRGNFIVLKVYKQMEDDQEGDLLRKYIASMFIKEACKEESKSPRYANVSIIRSSDFTDFSWKTPEEISEMMEVSHDAEILVMEYLSGESLKKGDVGKLSREVGSVAVLNLFTGPRDNSFKFQEEEVRVRKDSEVAYMGNILKMMRSVDVFAPEVAVRMRKYSEGLVWNKDVKRNSRTEEAIKKEIRETFSKVIIESTFAYREEKVDPMIEKTLGGLSFEVSEEEKGIVSKHYFEMLINMMLKYKRGGFNKFFAMAKGMRETYPKIQFEIEILEGYFEVLEEIYIKLSFYQEKLVGVKGIKTFKGDSINNRMAMTAQTYLFVGRYGEARSIVEKMFVSVKENGIERKHVEKEEVIDLFKEIDVRIKEVITASEEEVEPIEEERRKQIETNPLIQEPLKPEEEAGSIMGDKEMPEEAMKISIFMLEAPERHRVYYEMHGKNAVVGEYKNEKKEGLWCFYSSFGMIILKVRYKEGEIQEWWEYENSELREKKYLDVAVISDLVTKVLDRTIQDIEVQIGAMVQQ